MSEIISSIFGGLSCDEQEKNLPGDAESEEALEKFGMRGGQKVVTAEFGFEEEGRDEDSESLDAVMPKTIFAKRIVTSYG